ncbi:MAG: RiPP maturation radical SAM C-methyltransferase [Peptostreptococcaceae bacterium]|nr:RiPP maturation radical SAM C-methyltransferase [Peptostreptococcaceae bacterium]
MKDKTIQLPFQSAEVCLVCMPYCSPHIPSMALGLLQGELVKASIETRSIYANLLFCEQIGPTLYEKHHIADPRIPIAEWTFRSSAFPEFHPEDDPFIKQTYDLLSKIRSQSFETYVSDLNYVRQEAEIFIENLAEAILRLSPRIVGCTSSLAQRIPSLALLRKIKEMNPDVITIMGGSDCETIMGLTTHQQFHWVDYVVSGEGEDLIVPLVESLFVFGRKVPLDKLPKGVFAPLHREMGYPDINETGESGYQAIADSFGEQRMPLYQDYFDLLKSLPELSKNLRPSLPIQSSRGCWHGKCKFCGLNTPEIPYRSRPAQAVLAELDELSSSYGVKHFEFLDNILDMRCFDDLIDELAKRGAPYKIFYEIRSNLSKKQIKMLRKAGVILCQPGIESLHSDALKAMKKGVTAWQNIQTLKWCRQYGIKALWSILYDLPDDQDAWYYEMSQMVPLLTHLSAPMGMIAIQYQRNSYYFNHTGEYALDLKPLSLVKSIYPFNQDVIKNLSCTLDDQFSASRVNDPQMARLFRRAGVLNLAKEVNKWIHYARVDKKPMLSMKIEDERIMINDTRPIAVAASFQLNGLRRELYLLCDQARLSDRVHEIFLEKSYSSAEINTAAQSLIEDKLMIQIDKRWIALAIEEPFGEYMSIDQNPMGWMNVDKTVSDTKGRK